MDAALNGLANTVKHSKTKEAITVAKDCLKRFESNGDVPLVHFREKLLAAFELAFDHGSEKHVQYAVDGVQLLLRDQSYHDVGTEDTDHSLPSQILHSMTGIDEWKGQLQCKCVTLLVEMVCSNELKVTLSDVEQCLQIYKRLYGASDEERVRVACRAATTQSLAAYLSNRYAACDGEPQSAAIAVYLDVCKLLEELVADVQQMSSAHEQCLIALDAISALLTTSNTTILAHQPFANLLWEKLCPLIILLLGIPDAKGGGTGVQAQDEAIGEGQIDFALAPSVSANPHTWRALYQIVDQLIRLMLSDVSLASSLEALFHKAFLFPKLDQRSEALKVIRKIVGDGAKLSKIAKSCVATKSLSLWRMIMTCVSECANPQLELSIDAVRTTVAMLEGMKQLGSHRFFTDDERQAIHQFFDTNNEESEEEVVNKEEECGIGIDDEMSDKLRKLEQKFRTAPLVSRQSSELDESSERSTAKRFVESFCESVDRIGSPKSTLAVDEAILQFAADFYTNFCSVHTDAYKTRSKIQQEFLNTDAIYLTTYAALCFVDRRGKFTIDELKRVVLSSGCVIHVANGWLEKVFEALRVSDVASSTELSATVRDVINDFDGRTKCLLSDVEKLRRIQAPLESTNSTTEERNVARWLTSSAWQMIIDVLSTFLSAAKSKGSKSREKIREAISISICGMRTLVGVAQTLGLEARCGWIFEQLVETSCCLEELRNDATASDGEQKSTCTTREHLLAMQLVLDESRIAVHAPSCWKHIVRCTEYVWELEKYIYGALCYEKPSRLKFLRRRTEEREEDANEQTTAADNSIENAIGEEPTLSVHSLNRAICVLIAKIDRFYSQVCRELCLPALFDLCQAIVSSSENRIFYSSQSSPSQTQLSAPASLLSRMSDIISSLSHRPLIHQMIIYPLVSSHFVKVTQCDQESRIAATALAEVATRLLVAEPAGLCFNHTLLLPFQTATCSEACSDETKEQLLCALSSLVLSQADKIGAGWKPLFGSLKAVTASHDDVKVHWCVIDVISTYLRVDSPAVLSSSILECVPCVVNLLQSSEDDSEVARAAMRLLPTIYSLILYLYNTPHDPNYHLLHRSDLRSKCLDEVELEVDADLIQINHGPLPWDHKETHEIASVELFLSFVEQLCGTLLTSSSTTQKSLLDMIGRLLVDIAEKNLGADSGGVCMSAVILPFVQKWIRRSDVKDTRILKQVIGACTQTVIDMIELEKMSNWRDRLLRDICALIVECTMCDATCAVAPAYFTLIATHPSTINTTNTFAIFASYLAAASSISLRHLRLLNTFYVPQSTDERGDIGEITAYHPRHLQFQQFIAAFQVFSSKRGRPMREEVEEDVESGVALLMLSHGSETHRIEVSSLISSLYTHCLLLQLVASILLQDDEGELNEKLRASLIGSSTPIRVPLDDTAFTTIYALLDASAEAAIEFDARPAAASLVSKMIGIEHANLLRMLVAASLIKSLSLVRRNMIGDLSETLRRQSAHLKNVELEVSTRRSALVGREHAITQYHLIPLEEEKNAYKLVSQDFVDQTMQEYEKHRDRLKASNERQNPFNGSASVAAFDPAIEGTSKEEDFDEIRLAAYRDTCIIPMRTVIDSNNYAKSSYPLLLPAIKQVLLASPDLAVRTLAIDFMSKQQ